MIPEWVNPPALNSKHIYKTRILIYEFIYIYPSVDIVKMSTTFLYRRKCRTVINAKYFANPPPS